MEKDNVLKTVGNLVILSDLSGKGAFGTVHKGYLKNDTATILAVKILPRPQEIEDRKIDEFYYRLKTELKVMEEGLSHENIIKYFDAKFTTNNIYIMMEYCKHGDLSRIMNQLTKTQIITVLKSITEAMIYANGKSVLHRDLKPQNILIDEQIIKICDFGLAKFMTEETKMTPMIGTPYYMAPEVFKGENYDFKCDVWSMGIMLFQMVFHRHPWKNGSIERTQKEFFEYIDKTELEFPEDNACNECFIDLIRKMLEKDKKKRANWNEVNKHELLQGNISKKL